MIGKRPVTNHSASVPACAHQPEVQFYSQSVRRPCKAIVSSWSTQQLAICYLRSHIPTRASRNEYRQSSEMHYLSGPRQLMELPPVHGTVARPRHSSRALSVPPLLENHFPERQAWGSASPARNPALNVSSESVSPDSCRDVVALWL